MSALLDSLAAGFDGDASRRSMLDAALHDGLPGARSEAWKYTSLRALERRSFAPATSAPRVDAALLAGIPAPRLVFVNGRHDAALSDVANLAAGISLQSRTPAQVAANDADSPSQRADDVFARLNLALAGSGVALNVADHTFCSQIVHLVFIGAPSGSGQPSPDQAWHLRHAIMLGANARLALVEHHIAAGEHAHLANAGITIALQAGAELVHARVQRDAAASTHLLRTDVKLAANAHYQRLDLELGAGLSRHELNVRLDGDGARLAANGVLLAQGRQHLDTRLGIEHAARDTVCELLWRGLGADRGRVVFHGGITIHAGADGSDANLSNKNLLLGDNAEIDAQPVLEIHADEVKAAHGATVGQLDPNALFYLRTRGLPLAQAQRLLTTAFAREPLSMIEDTGVRALLEAQLDKALEALVPA